MKLGSESKSRLLIHKATNLRQGYPRARMITLVMENFKTHTASAFYKMFESKEAKRLWNRFEIVYTPKIGVGITWQK